jgi:putative exporter of polyketide antibiotics
MRTVFLLSLAFLRHNRWFAVVLCLWPWIFAALILAGGENDAEDYAGILQQEAFYGIAIAGFMATAALHNELRSRRVVAVLSKAVSRKQYLAGFLAGFLLIVLLFVVNIGGAALVAASRMHAPVGRGSLLLFLLSMLIIAGWLGALGLMFSTFLHPIVATIFMLIGAAAPLAATKFADNRWTVLLPSLPIFSSLAKSPFAAGWNVNPVALLAAVAEAAVFILIGAWAFRYRDLTRAIE